MKTAHLLAVLVFTLTLFAVESEAREGLYQRTCRQNGGQTWNVMIPGEQISLCKFNGYGVLAETFYITKEESKSTEAIESFFKSPKAAAPGDDSQCEAFDGAEIPGRDLEGRTIMLCTFSDGSIIETNALEAGPARATELARALR